MTPGRKWRALVRVCGIAVLICSGRSARTEPLSNDDPDTELARKHFEAGSAHYSEGRYAPALAEFEATRMLKPTAPLDYNIGRCLERMARWAEAVDAYGRYLAKLPADAQQDLRARVGVLRRRAAEQLARESRPTPLARRPAFWLGLVGGVAVVGGALTVGLILGLRRPDPTPTFGGVSGN